MQGIIGTTCIQETTLAKYGCTRTIRSNCCTLNQNGYEVEQVFLHLIKQSLNIAHHSKAV